MAFLARLVGILTPSAVEGASRDVGDRGRALVEGVSEEIERLLVGCFGEGSGGFEADGSNSGIREGEVGRFVKWREDREKSQQRCIEQEIGGLMGNREG